MPVITDAMLQRDFDYMQSQAIFQCTLVFGTDTVVGTITEKASRAEVEGGMDAGRLNIDEYEWVGDQDDFTTLPTTKETVELTCANLGLASVVAFVDRIERAQDGIAVHIMLKVEAKG